MLDQALTVFRKDSGHPNRVVHGESDKPAKKQVVIGLLHELALRTDATEDLKQHDAQQLLRRDAGAPTFNIAEHHISPAKKRGREVKHRDQFPTDIHAPRWSFIGWRQNERPLIAGKQSAIEPNFITDQRGIAHEIYIEAF